MARSGPRCGMGPADTGCGAKDSPKYGAKHGDASAEASIFEVVELDLNRTLAENGIASHGCAEGDEPALLLYWTDDLTS